MVDLDFAEQKEPHYAKMTDEWEVIYQVPFLDAAKSKTIYRAFYVPFLSEKHNKFNNYYLLRSKKLVK
jgi:alpha-1,2-mannosyltransferase